MGEREVSAAHLIGVKEFTLFNFPKYMAPSINNDNPLRFFLWIIEGWPAQNLYGTDNF